MIVERGEQLVDLSKIETEKCNNRSKNFSSMSIMESIKLMNQEDFNAVKCIETEYSKIEKLINKTSKALKTGHRIIYIGAGTSGRLGVLDAVECPPTFGVDYNTVVGLMAGGDKAFVEAKEGAEDNDFAAVKDLKNINLSKYDVLIGLAASGRTPYVIGAINYAKSIGVYTGAIVCSKNSEIAEVADITIEAVPGPEVLTGSTRLKAGTATKLILNMISTISMKEIGKIYQNYMVDLKLSNKKLQQRGHNIVKEVTGESDDRVSEALLKSNSNVKLAIVMLLFNLSFEEAVEKLKEADGSIDRII